MIKLTTNITVVLNQVTVGIDKVKNPDAMLRNIASTLTGVIRNRVHTEGKASDGSQIGTYSKGYMQVRTGNYKNAARVSKGAKKGSLKNAGTFTDRTIRLDKNTGVFSGDDKAGTARPVYNRTADTKVVLSLTRQMENDFGTNEADPAKTASGWGIGYKNPLNFDKSQWVEKTYKKPIWQLTEGEADLVNKIADKYATDAFTGENS